VLGLYDTQICIPLVRQEQEAMVTNL